MACNRTPHADDTVENIRVLSGLEPIRLNPGLYVGDTGSSGLSHILFELISNSLAEIVAGNGRSVRVTLHVDGSAEVDDDGSVIPSNDVERTLTFIGTGYRPPPTGRDYFWYVVANALSERLSIAVRSDGSRYQHVFTRGITNAVVQTGGPPNDRGLTITFRPDAEIFGDAAFDRVAIRDRLQQLAYLHSGVRITFVDETAGTHDEFEFADGIAAYVRWLNVARQPLHDEVIIIRGEERSLRYEVGLQWCADPDEIRMSFANHYGTRQGGSHDSGVRTGAAMAIRDFVREFQSEAGELPGEDMRAGLTAVVSVWLAEPQFCGPTRLQLSNPEAEAIVRTVVRRGVCEYFETNREAAKRVVDAVIAARATRLAFQAERKRKRQFRNE